jgi:dTDP-4-amino-4,6-dideoxygalactose transaminase
MEQDYMAEVINLGRAWGGGKFTTLCQDFLSRSFESEASILTTSATDALEMAAVLLNVKPGDEVIMPSYTFVSTANAFVTRGATPVFVDVHRETQLIDSTLVESAVTDRTVAIVPVHYAGNSCDMISLRRISRDNNLKIVEDAAQAIGSKDDGIPVGSLGDLSCVSFHGTKNVVCGEGGAINVYDESLVERAFHISEKGTNRRDFVNGRVDKYTWVDHGSSFIPSEILAAYLWSQLQHLEEITLRRLDAWNQYMEVFSSATELLAAINVGLPSQPSTNGHLFPLIFPNKILRDSFIAEMASLSIELASHYTALHSSSGGKRYGRLGSSMENTDWVVDGLVRLPIWSEPGLPVEHIVQSALTVLKGMGLRPPR